MKSGRRLAFCGLLCLCLTARISNAGKYNSKLDIGDPAPVWKDLPGVDGNTHSLVDLKEKDFVVVFFHSCSCDVAEEYEPRIKDFSDKFAGPEGKVAVVAINVSKLAEDRLPAMKERAEKHEFNFSYLFDESQQIAREYGAVWTPEFFILDRERKIAYMGGIDDTSAIEFVKHHYLEDAVQALLKGETPEVRETPPIGCRIRFERQRRRAPRPAKEN